MAYLPKADAASASRRRRSSSFHEINVTPFVDVMLVLLVIFMITAPMITAGVTVDLPESSAKPIAGKDEPLVVTINEDAQIFIQESPTTLDELGPKLLAIAGENKQMRIFVRGDQNIAYGKLMRVMGEINAHGLKKVALITEALK